MAARFYLLAVRVLPYVSLAPLGALLLVQFFGSAK